MDMDSEFISNAKKVERFLTGANEKLLNTKRSLMIKTYKIDGVG